MRTPVLSTAPCRGFQAAVNIVPSGGEVIALNSAGYGTITINKAVTINTPSGVYAGVSVPTGGTGITVTAGSSDSVIILNVQINGSGATNTLGVQHNSGKLSIVNSNFTQLTTGFYENGSKTDLIDDNFSGNGTGIKTEGVGSDYDANPHIVGPTMVRIAGGNIVGNTNGIVISDPGFKPCVPANNATCYPNCTLGVGYCSANPNNVPIFFLHTSGGYDIKTNVAGNDSFISGTGTGCTDPDPNGSPFCVDYESQLVYGNLDNPH